MIFLQRKIRAQYCGKEEYRPEQMPTGKYLPVIGWKTEKRTVTVNGKQQIVDQEFFMVIGNNGIPLNVIAFNCKVMIDDRSEIDMVSLSQMTNNITIMGKAICEKLAGVNHSSGTEKLPEKSGKKSENSNDQSV